MKRLVTACAASLLLYAALFGCVLDRSLDLGYLRHEIDAKLARGASIGGPKLVILAGSNGPYSHRCEIIEPMIGMPCENAGVAVGIGLDYLFARWRPLLHPGDVMYLPMEEEQYARSRAANAVGPAAAIMFRRDWHTLAMLPPDRWIGALFSSDLSGGVMAVLEEALVATGFKDPRAAFTGTTNRWGDHVGHTLALAAASRAELAVAVPVHASAASIRDGYGTRLIVGFLRWAKAHGVRVIGGLPTEFADSPMPDATRAAIRAVYAANGAAFLELPNHSLYPRVAFFDTPLHLNEPWQIVHSRAVAKALIPMLRGQVLARASSDDDPHARAVTPAKAGVQGCEIWCSGPEFPLSRE
jgi:hypothetical protein